MADIIEKLIKQGETLNRQFVGHTDKVVSRRVSVERVKIPLGTVRVYSAETVGVMVIGHYIYGEVGKYPIGEGGFVLDDSILGLLDANNILDGGIGTPSVVRVVNYKNIFKERFSHEEFINSSLTTANVVTSSGRCYFTNDEVYRSEVFALNNNAYNNALLTVNGLNTSNLDHSISFDGGSTWNSITPDTILNVTNNSVNGLISNTVASSDGTFPLNNLQAYYPFEGDANDSHGSYNGSVTGAVLSSSGILGSCYSFDGSSDKITATNMITSYPFTLSAWVKMSSLSGEQNIVSIGDSSVANVYYCIRFHGGTGKFRITCANTIQLNGNSTTDADTNNWFHVVGVFRGDTDKELFINGSSEATLTSSCVFNSATDTVGIGMLVLDSDYWDYNGLIDEVGVWDRALSSAEIEYLYNSGSSRTYTDFSETYLSEFKVVYN